MRVDYLQLQYEAACVLTNIASETSENTKVVIDYGAVPIFVNLLASPSDDVRDEAIWALGIVAGDSPRCHDLVLGEGALIPLLAQLSEHAKLSMLRITIWTLSNLCKGKPQPPFDQVRPALPTLAQLIHLDDEEVLSHACWTLSYLSDGTNDKIQVVIEAGVCRRLVELLGHPSPLVLTPALRIVGNIVTGDDFHTHSGNREHIQAVIDAGLIGPLVNLLQDVDFDIKNWAAWAISNATFRGTHEQIKYLVREGCIKPLCDLLLCADLEIVNVCLEGLENILKVGEVEKNTGSTTGEVNQYARLVEAGGLKKIEGLKSHDDNGIREKAVKILETYWFLEEDYDTEEEDAQGSDY
ncbi:hypothetical protein WN944_007245 [Citrus x changshan-huyou]|uniref:Importin subunit alpha n=1 Tax=Citrus x changshan-huyou TaxID=2935761 RepID=A0AAP0MQG4_9ROSI